MKKVLVVVGVVAGGIWLGGLLWHRFAAAPADDKPSDTALDQPAPQTEQAAAGLADAGGTRPAAAGGEAAVPVQGPVDWEAQRDDILKSGTTADEKSDRLLGLLPRLSEAEQEDAARHLVNLLSDERMLSRGEACLTNLQSSRAVQSALFSDLMNRPEKIKLVLWLAVMRTPEHPDAEEARSQLSLYVPEDLGTNWAAWESAVRKHLE